MKFALAKEHHDFFDKQGFIQFEDLITPASIERLSKATRQQIGSRINLLPEKLFPENPSRLFLAGRDLWRNHPEIKKQALNRNLATITSGLVRQKPIRLALDQWIPPGMDWKNITTLEEMVPVQGLLAGAFIALDSGVTGEDTPVFPSQPGNILIVKPDTILPLHELTSERNQSFLLVVYGSRNSVYIHKESDPLTHYLKELDYVFGDRLSDSLHPLLLQ